MTTSQLLLWGHELSKDVCWVVSAAEPQGGFEWEVEGVQTGFRDLIQRACSALVKSHRFLTAGFYSCLFTSFFGTAAWQVIYWTSFYLPRSWEPFSWETWEIRTGVYISHLMTLNLKGKNQLWEYQPQVLLSHSFMCCVLSCHGGTALPVIQHLLSAEIPCPLAHHKHSQGTY